MSACLRRHTDARTLRARAGKSQVLALALTSSRAGNNLPAFQMSREGFLIRRLTLTVASQF